MILFIWVLSLFFLISLVRSLSILLILSKKQLIVLLICSTVLLVSISLISVQNLWDAAKVVLRGKYIAIQTFLKKQERSTQPNLTPKGAGERIPKNPKPSRRRELIKIRALINEIETKRTIEQLN